MREVLHRKRRGAMENGVELYCPTLDTMQVDVSCVVALGHDGHDILLMDHG